MKQQGRESTLTSVENKSILILSKFDKEHGILFIQLSSIEMIFKFLYNSIFVGMF